MSNERERADFMCFLVITQKNTEVCLNKAEMSITPACSQQ